MTLVELVIQNIQGDISFYKEKVSLLEQRLPVFSDIAGKIGGTSILSIPVVFYGSTFSLTPLDSETSFRITSVLLELFPEIKSFKKVFVGDRKDPEWKWEGLITVLNVPIFFDVYKATPNTDCLPRQRSSTYTSWLCDI